MISGTRARAGQPAAPATTAYRRRQPEQGALYRVLAEHLETFLARASADETRPRLPRFVKRELRGYLRCGLLCHGFARVRCRSCGRDILVAFSCKGTLCANQGGFSLHAEVHVRAHDRVRLEHLCRYVARGPIAAERLSLSADGKVIYRLL